MKIIIPFKETSLRCSNKNFELFPFTYEWLKRQNISDSDIIVTSSSKSVKDYVLSYNVCFIQENGNVGDIIASYDAAIQLDLETYIWVPLTQPLRNDSLIQQISNELVSSDCDFITTYQMITDRSLFYIDKNSRFINESVNRKGCMCAEQRMLDGAIYGIRTSFMDKIVDATDINAKFWSGNFKAIENKVDFFADIDTESDMKRFRILSCFC